MIPGGEVCKGTPICLWPWLLHWSALLCLSLQLAPVATQVCLGGQPRYPHCSCFHIWLQIVPPCTGLPLTLATTQAPAAKRVDATGSNPNWPTNLVPWHWTWRYHWGLHNLCSHFFQTLWTPSILFVANDNWVSSFEFIWLFFCLLWLKAFKLIQNISSCCGYFCLLYFIEGNFRFYLFRTMFANGF